MAYIIQVKPKPMATVLSDPPIEWETVTVMGHPVRFVDRRSAQGIVDVMAARQANWGKQYRAVKEVWVIENDVEGVVMCIEEAERGSGVF